MNRVYRPFTDDQVKSINAAQDSVGDRWWKWLVCDNSVNGSHGPLYATEYELECNACAYTQDWAPEWLADWSWSK